MESIESLLSKVASGEELTYEQFDALRGYQETLDDAFEVLKGREDLRSGMALEAVRPKSSGAGFAIVVGHTKSSPGATGVKPIGQSEYPWNKDLAAKIKAACSAKGIESDIFYRDGVGIAGAYAEVEQWGAACVVELHFNASNGKASGTMTLYDKDRHTGSSSWAKLLQDSMLATLALRDFGLKELKPGDRGYASVSALKIPSALIEPFFGDNASDAETATNGKDRLAAAIAEAAARHLKIA